MYKELKYNGGKIAYNIEGEGYPIVLLHGYLESLNAWEEFGKELAVDNQIISIDLPGHGSTSLFGSSHSMNFMADCVHAVLENEKIERCIMVGHSMGGYVTMEFLHKYPERLSGLSLFHSTPFADSEEKRKVRDRLIEAIEAGKFVSLAKEHVEKTFAKENLSKFVTEIGYLKIIAINTPPEGAIAALKGMKNRDDLSNLLEQTDKPVLWILGSKDNFIDPQIYKKLKLTDNVTVKILNNSGHQGYIEEKHESIRIFKDFISNKKLKK